MRTLSFLACGSLLALAAAAQPVSESRLLSEPMWTLQVEDGPPVSVWFERTGDKLEIVRCAGRAPACRSEVELGRAPAVVSDGQAMFLTVVDARIPVLSAGPRANLFPAWVIPGRGSRVGH